MGGPGSGGHNAARQPTSTAAVLVQPLPWPWENADAAWTREDIHVHLLQYTYESGLSREHLGDVIAALATHHWMRQQALNAIRRWETGDCETDEPTVAGINAYRLLLNAEEKIAGDWRRLGVTAQDRRQASGQGSSRRSFRPEEKAHADASTDKTAAQP